MTISGIEDLKNNRWTDESSTSGYVGPSGQIEYWRDYYKNYPSELAEFDAWVKAEALEDGVVTDAINPTHYQFPGGIQVIDLTRHLGFLEGNIVKYVARAGRKGAAKEDLLKARQYLDWLIEDTDD